MAAATRPERAQASTAQRLGIALACALLTLCFIVAGFPYDRLAQRLTGALERATGTRISIGEMGPSMSLAGPGFEAAAVRVTTRGGARLDLARARVRPAWSTAWLRATPALHVSLEGPGRIDGVVTLDAAPAFAGELEEVDLRQLPWSSFWPGSELSGLLNATVDLAREQAWARGSVELHAREGSLTAPAVLPVTLPFASLDGTLRLGDGALLEVESLAMDGPLFKATANGRIAEARSLAAAPLDLHIDLEANPRQVGLIQGAGIPMTRDGRGSLRVRGTVSAPEIR